MMRRAAVLDLGSRTFHLLVADVDQASIQPVLRQRARLDLGRVVQQHGRITGEATASAVRHVEDLCELARAARATTLTITATAALREAANSVAVIERLTAAAGAPIRLLSVEEEGQLTYQAACAAVATAGAPTLVLDLGGGSLELIFGDHEVRRVFSFPLGVSRLSAQVEVGEDLREDHRRVTMLVDDHLGSQVTVGLRPGIAIACGGTVRALARLAREQQLSAGSPASTSVSAALEGSVLRELARALSRNDGVVAEHLDSAKERRRLFLGAVVLHRTLERLAIDAVTVSAWGLREGVLLDQRGR